VGLAVSGGPLAAESGWNEGKGNESTGIGKKDL
jgi:hypothetical protein